MGQKNTSHINQKDISPFLKEWEAPILKTLSLTKTEDGDSANSSESFFQFLLGAGGS